LNGTVQGLPTSALIIENMEVTHSNIELNGFELNAACAVTMNGQSYIFQAVKRRTVDRDTGFPEGRPYVLLLGGVRRLLIPSIFHMIESSLPKDIYAIRPTLFLDPNSRELKFYSKMRDLYGLSTCVNWSPGAYGKSELKHNLCCIRLLKRKYFDRSIKIQ